MGKGNDPNCKTSAPAMNSVLGFAATKTAKKSKVSEIMSVVNPDELDAIDGVETPEAPKTKIAAKELKPIARPGGSEYFPRPLEPTGMTDVQVLRKAREAGTTVLLGGYPGCGKTAMIEAAYGEDLYTVEGNGDMEVSDLVGSWQPTGNPDSPYAWEDGPLVRAMKEGKPLFVDDITLISAPVLARLYPAMDGRGKINITEHDGEEVTAKEGFFVVGAHNPGAPGAVLSEALASRFALQPRVESNLNLAVEMGVNRRVVKAAKNLRGRRERGEISWSPEMRELLSFRDVSGIIGETAAAANMIEGAPEDCRDALMEVLTPIYPDIVDFRVGD